MNPEQPRHRSRIPKIAAVACSLVLMAGYVHYSATGRFFPGGSSKGAAPTAAQQQAAPPTQSLLPGSKDALMFPSSKIGIISVDPPAEHTEFFGGSKSRMLINPQEERTEFFVGSKSAEIFDEHDVAPASETPASETPSSQPDSGE